MIGESSALVVVGWFAAFDGTLQSEGTGTGAGSGQKGSLASQSDPVRQLLWSMEVLDQTEMQRG